MKTLTLLRALAFGIATVASSSQAATTSGELTFSYLGYTLTDLDPNDGVAPFLSFRPVYQSSVTVGQTIDYPFTHYGNDFSDKGYQPLSADLVSPWGRSSAALEGTSLATMVSKHSSILDGNGAVSNLSYSRMERSLDPALITPNTKVEFFADVTTKAFASGGSFYQGVTTFGMMTITGGAYVSDVNYNEAAPIMNGDQIIGYTGFDRNESARLSLSFINDRTDYNIIGLNFYTGVDMGTSVSITPVPEPATYGMLLAGLAVVGGMARRARARR